MASGDVKYRSIFDILRSEILVGKYDRRRSLPSESQLTARFGASRPTVIRAMQALQAAGLVERRRGSGTFLTAVARNVTGHLGMIVPGHRNTEIFTPICAEIARCARLEGYTMLFGDASSPHELEREEQALSLAREYARSHVAGVFLEPVELLPGSPAITRGILDHLTRNHMAVVLIDRDIVRPPARSEFDLVGIDNEGAGYKLAAHVIAQGARNIHFFARPNSAPTVLQRIRGVTNAVVEARLPWSAASVCIAQPDDAEVVRALFRKRRPPDAILCGNDITAARLLQTLLALGHRVPDDVLLAGFDDVKCASLVSPMLTTIRQPCEQIAQTAVQTLLQRIRNPRLPPREIRLTTELVVRDSTTRKAARNG